LVDDSRQKQLRCMHTGAHLLNAAARKVLGQHIWQAGAEKDVSESHLDVTHYRQITKEELDLIEDQVNSWILDGSKVNIFELPKDEAEKKYGFRLYQGGAIPGNSLRIIEIPNIDVQACAGLHLHEIKDIGIFKIIKRTSVQDGVERIFYTTQKAALAHIKEQERYLEKSSDILCVNKHELAKTLGNFFREWKEQRKEIDSLKHRIAEYEIDNIVNTHDKTVIAKFNLDTTEILKVFKQVQQSEKSKDKIIAIYNNNGNIFIWRGPESKESIDEIKKELEKKLGKQIKGGGNPLFQGKVN